MTTVTSVRAVGISAAAHALYWLFRRFADGVPVQAGAV
ncbi:hypothetical protein SA2016_2581 [Sinomonas atrocyanea]|uniref:Uncharacterized protein n=1 Tax=Sinomonas atrocyanea TaxID=37927 RepID=A0A127A1A5_9MICC|nr:hypothetical protein SA2016_2581 [Sinomonas atrocyanea]